MARIPAEDLIDILSLSDALETFNRLPLADRQNFSRWVGQARDDESKWRRIEALVLAMRMYTLQPNEPHAPALEEGAVG